MWSPGVDADVYAQDRALNHANGTHPLMMTFSIMATLANLCYDEVNETLRTGYVFDTFTPTVHTAIGHPDGLAIGAVVCTQAYMDIIDTVGASQLPSKFLAAMKNYIKRSVEEHRFDASLPIDENSIEDDNFRAFKRFMHESMRLLSRDTLMCIITDHVERKVSENVSDLLRGQCGSSKVMLLPLSDLLPVLSGLASATLGRLSYRDGIATFTTDESVLAMAHLYTTARASSVLDIAWPDVDYLTGHLGRGSFGIVECSRSASPVAQCVRDYSIVLGVPLIEYSKERSSKRAKSARPSLPSVGSMRRKQPSLEPKTAYASAVLKTEGHSDVLERYGDSVMDIFHHTLAQMLITCSSDAVSSQLCHRRDFCKELQPVDLLSILGAALKSDEMHIAFGFREFSAGCSTMFNVYQDMCDPKYKDKEHLDKERAPFPPFVEMLSMSCGTGPL